MNKYDVNKKKLKIGDIVVLCNCLEATTRNFEFWEVYADSKIECCVFIRGLSTGKSDCFDCEKLKKVDKKHKELIDKATPKKVEIKEYVPVVCPHCRKELSISLGDGYYEVPRSRITKHCKKCGGALDWSATE